MSETEQLEEAVGTVDETVAEETQAAAETVAEETKPTISDRLQERLDSGRQQAVEEAVEEPETPEGTEAEPAEESPEPTGPSSVMKTVARQQGVEEYVIGLAHSDEELEEVIGKRIEELEAKETKAPEAAPPKEFELGLSEEEFPADDPLRKCFSEMNDHYKGKIEVLESAYKELLGNAINVNQERQAQQQAIESQWFSQFHSGLDELNSEALGQSAEYSEESNDMRKAVYSTLERLQKTHPETSPKELGQMAAKKLGLARTTVATKEAVREGNRRVSAGKPAQTVKTPLSSNDRIQAHLDRLGTSTTRRRFLEPSNGASKQ